VPVDYRGGEEVSKDERRCTRIVALNPSNRFKRTVIAGSRKEIFLI